ncbi:hypothetical protein [Cerasicoccus frondis]|uniref:hypothetical protein n=1 Tax=Cerasicoccus frondis TaxID=490090 RepID=UPI00285269F8|nr:hypothetical protein [Cerasicoccus frondis]
MHNHRSGATALHLDHTDYEKHLKHFDLTDPQKRALLDTLFEIVVHFVDMDLSTCGKEPQNRRKAPLLRHDSVSLDHPVLTSGLAQNPDCEEN